MKDYEIVAEKLKMIVGTDNYIDIGDGAEYYMGVDATVFLTAVLCLMKEGYPVQTVPIPQVGGKKINYINVLCPKDSTANAAYEHRFDIKVPVSE